jgi:outer membrane receptor protein involved in Fe transport
MKSTFRQRLLTSTLIFGAATMASPAWAQSSDDQQSETPIESQIDPDAQSDTGTDSIVVTGSRIRRPDLQSTSPLAVVQDEEFRLSGSVNVEQVINTLPQIVPGLTGFSNNPGNGAVTLDLRGLGATRTLVLVNGRRYLFYDVNQIVDTNTIPQFLLEGVDVVTGGASAVYGSDAIAGVVNFRLRQNLNGIEAGALYAITERGDGARYSADVAVGSNFGDGRGNVTAYASYTERRPIFQGSRAFSFNAAGDACIVPGSTDPRTSLGRNFGGTLATCVARGGEVGLIGQGSGTTDTATLLLPVASGGTQIFDPNTRNIRPFVDPDDLFNYAPANYLQLPQRRYLIGGYGSYEINESIQPFFEVGFVNNVVATELAATPAAASAPLQIASPFLTPQAQAFLAGFRDPANPNFTTPITVARRFEEAGSRNSNFNRDAFRVLAGLKGDLTENLQYEAYYSYARTRNTAFQSGNIATSRFTAALTTEVVNGQLRCVSAMARAAGCVPLNVFGRDTISPEALRYIQVASTNQDISSLKNAVAAISGTAFNLGLGAPDIGFALGAEYREPSSRFIPDYVLSSATSGLQCRPAHLGQLQRQGSVRGIGDPDPARLLHPRLELNGPSATPITRSGTSAASRPTRSVLSLRRFRTSRSAVSSSARCVRRTFKSFSAASRRASPAAADPCSDRGTAANRTDTVRALCIASGVPAAGRLHPRRAAERSGSGLLRRQSEPRRGDVRHLHDRCGYQAEFHPAPEHHGRLLQHQGGGCHRHLRRWAEQRAAVVLHRRAEPHEPRLRAFHRDPQYGDWCTGRHSGRRQPAAPECEPGDSGDERRRSSSRLQPAAELLAVRRRKLEAEFLLSRHYLDKYRNTAIAAIPERVTISEGTPTLPEYKHTAVSA